MELKFKADTKQRKEWFTGVSFSHPAKMSLPLQLWIIENYTKPGDTLLDTMAGSGTILVACSLGRNVIAVELEAKFIEIMKGNWERIKQRGPQLGYQMGECQIIQGDARNLGNILVDHAIFSPPYAETTQKLPDNYHIPITGSSESKGTDYVKLAKYSDDPDNIGNLPYGDIASIIISPPYEGSVSDNKESPLAGGNEAKYGRWKDGTAKKISYTQHSEPSKIDSIVTSPPYALTGVGDWQTGRAEFQAWVISELAAKGYVEWQGKRYTESEWRAMNHGRIDGRTTKGVHKHPTDGYGEANGQIGNLKAESYLSAMLQVYRQCHSVLRPGGLLILVTKNFIRNKKEVRLDEDTMKLCDQAGFQFVERHYRKLSAQSFWRVIYRQKYPDAPVLDKEDIMIFLKPSQSLGV